MTIVLVLVGWVVSAGAQEGAAVNVGLVRFDVDNPVGGAAISTVAWYPTKAAAAPRLFGPYRTDVAVDAAAVPGRYP